MSQLILPLVFALILGFVLSAIVAMIWERLRTRARIRQLVRVEMCDLLEVKERLSRGPLYWCFVVLLTFIFDVGLAAICYTYFYAAVEDNAGSPWGEFLLFLQNGFGLWVPTFSDGKIVPLGELVVFALGAIGGIIFGGKQGRKQASHTYELTSYIYVNPKKTKA